MQVPADYEKSFKQADETFLYQLVFDPVSRSLVPLNELPEGVQPGNLEFAGPYPCAAVINLIMIAGFISAMFFTNFYWYAGFSEVLSKDAVDDLINAEHLINTVIF